VDGAGRPAAGARIEAIGGDGLDAAEEAAMLGGGLGLLAIRDLRIPVVLTGTDGSIEFRHFEPGNYRLSAEKGGRRSAEAAVEVREGATASATLVIPGE
jgi:hypothetical protein